MKKAEDNRGVAERFDWDDIKRRLPPTLQLEQSADELASQFRRRAEELARVPKSDDAGSGDPHIEFGVGAVRFAVALRDVRSIVAPNRITRLPGAPDALAHVIHAEGRLVPLVDLSWTFKLDAPAKSQRERPLVLLLDTAGSPLGLRVSRVHGFRSIEVATLAPTRGAGVSSDLLRGITSEMTLVLSVPQLLTSLRDAVRSAQLNGPK